MDPTSPDHPLEIVQGEDDHYKVEKVLQSKLTPNRRGILYLVKWKGYPDSENSWLPALGMKQAQALVKQFHQKNPSAPHSPSIKVLSVQHDLKEGILSQTYALVRDGLKGNANLQGIASSSSCNGVNSVKILAGIFCTTCATQGVLRLSGYSGSMGRRSISKRPRFSGTVVQWDVAA
jgi:hypothetical protein